MPSDAASGGGYALGVGRDKKRPRRRPRPRPKPTPAPQIRRPEFTGRRPAARPRPTYTLPRTTRTDVQSERRGHGGRQRSSSYPTKRQVELAKKQERSYYGKKVSDRLARDNRRLMLRTRKRRRRELMRARRRRYFPRDIFRATQESQRNALQALADLKAQDPEKYERRQRSWVENAAKDVADYIKDRSRDRVYDPTGRATTRRMLSDLGGAADRGLKAAAAHSSKGIDDLKESSLAIPVIGDLSKEALDLIANAPSGAYQTGDAAVSAIKGDSRKARRLIKDFKDTSALYPLVKGDLKEAGRRAKERPLTTVLELSGAKAAVGRGGGAAMRRSPSRRLRQIASTERAPQRLYTPAETKRRSVRGGSRVGGVRGPAVQRRYSRDIFNKGLQVAGERIQRRRGRDPNVDYGSRLRPGATLDQRRSVRRQLDREVDRQVFSASRALEQRRLKAAKGAKRATGHEREQLLRAARADKIRAELRETARLTANKQKRRTLLRLAKLDDRKLIGRIDEIAALAKRDPDAFGGVSTRRPNVALEQRPEPLETPVHRAQGADAWERLAALRGTDEDLVPTAVARAVNDTALENSRLIAAEFGIPVGKRGYVKTAGAAERIAAKIKKQDPSADLVPLRVEDGKYMLAPRPVVERFEKHAAVDRSSLTGTPFDAGTRLFKDVVLTTSSPSRWLGGNIADIGLRSMNEGITPFDVWRGRQIDRRLKQHGLQGEQASANLTGGGLMGISDDLAQLGPVSRFNLPARGWRAWKRGIYTVEHAIEKTAQQGRVGKSYRRDNQRQVNSLRGLMNLQKEAVDRYARGLATDRSFEARVAREVENLIGRWGKVSPGMRRTLSLAPFAQWLGAATRYVLVTLPVHHPIKTGILAAIMQMTEQERMRLGLSYFAPDAMRAPDYQMGLLPTTVLTTPDEVKEYARAQGLTPAELQSMLSAVEHGPVVRGWRTSRMTSFGTAGNPGEWPSFALPQFAGAFNAMRGQSFTGEPLVYPDYYPEDQRGVPLSLMDRIPVAVGAQLETALPFASAFRRSVLEGGQPSEPFSTILTPAVRRRFDYDNERWVKPEGSWQQGLKKWATPFAPEGRIYTLGAQRDIEATQKAMRKIKEWNKERVTTPGLVDPYDSNAKPARKEDKQFVDPYAAQPSKPKRPKTETFVDPYATP